MCGVYKYLLEKDTSTVAISFECLIFCEKLEDIKWYNNCPSAFLQQIYVNKTRFQYVILCLCNTKVILTKLIFKFKDL